MKKGLKVRETDSLKMMTVYSSGPKRKMSMILSRQSSGKSMGVPVRTMGATIRIMVVAKVTPSTMGMQLL